ncbi:hypothetical protein PY365_23830 [Roseiarcaceae bacterium H3SJ34-1]|uniref:hypothetical protein n=1 Tax=Terripilifer ovatus TaxID=3032367 RepID=UPI003AB91B31|nr:hypothetical protein [Roseiarcaceae bacterium H3SJ34-1]
MMGFKFVTAKNEQNNQWLENESSSLTQLKLRKGGIRSFPYIGDLNINPVHGNGFHFDVDGRLFHEPSALLQIKFA